MSKVSLPFVLLAALAGGLLLGSQVAAQTSAVSGDQIFRQRCQACHTAVAGQPARVGPNLAGVVGRKAASTAFNYSPALKSSGLIWTKANLDRFLTGPARMVPGTRMSVVMSDAAQRAAVIQYLSQAR